jgi:hypothetical protein
VISGFRREIEEKCALLGCYAARVGNFLPTFCNRYIAPKRRVRNYQQALRNNPEERRSQCIQQLTFLNAKEAPIKIWLRNVRER